jgi:hypothetical protein
LQAQLTSVMDRCVQSLVQQQHRALPGPGAAAQN